MKNSTVVCWCLKIFYITQIKKNSRQQQIDLRKSALLGANDKKYYKLLVFSKIFISRQMQWKIFENAKYLI